MQNRLHGGDALNTLLQVRLTAGQRYDSNSAQSLLDGFSFQREIADRGYAGGVFIAYLQARNRVVVILPHQGANVQRDYDTWWYHEQHLIKCCLNELKRFRRIFFSFD